LEVPRDREGEFVTEVFERYKRMTGNVEEAILEIYLSGISTRKIAGITDALSRVRIGKDAVSRIASRLEEQQKAWRERSLKEKEYPYRPSHGSVTHARTPGGENWPQAPECGMLSGLYRCRRGARSGGASPKR
jgi:transposase-like protein